MTSPRNWCLNSRVTGSLPAARHGLRAAYVAGVRKIHQCKDTMNCAEKAMKISHFNPNQSAPSIYIMIELYYFSLDQWEIRIHLLWGKSFNIPHHFDPHLNQTKFNDLLPLTIHGPLAMIVWILYTGNWTLSFIVIQNVIEQGQDRMIVDHLSFDFDHFFASFSTLFLL